MGILDAEGEPVPGFSPDDCDEIRGNSVAATVSWNGKAGVSALASKPVRLHFVMHSTKLYAFQFK